MYHPAQINSTADDDEQDDSGKREELAFHLIYSCAPPVFCRRSTGHGGLQTATQRVVLQSDGAPPDIVESHKIADLQLEKRALRHQHLRVGLRHVLIFLEVELICSCCPRDELRLVPVSLELSGKIRLRQRSCLLCERELFTQDILICALNFGFRRFDVALVPVPERNADTNASKALRSGSPGWVLVDVFPVVLLPSPQLEVGDGFALRILETGLCYGRLLQGALHCWTVSND